MFSVREDEKPAIKNWGEQNKVEITTVSEDLSTETVDLAEGYEGICVQQRTELKDEELYRNLSDFNIKYLALRTAGYDIVDLDLARKYKVIVTNVPEYSPRSVAELVLTQVMRLIRNLPIIEANMIQGDFRWSGLVAKELHTLTIGIIGAGRIGGTVARLFSSLGATVIAYDPLPREDLKDVLIYKQCQKEVLSESDVVSIHVPLNKETTTLIDDEAMHQMKNGAFLINAARGPVVDTQALIAALEAGEIAGAALDTLVNEAYFFNQDLRGQKIPDEHLNKLMEMNNVLITPHIGFYTDEAVKNMVDTALNCVKELVSTGESDNEVY